MLPALIDQNYAGRMCQSLDRNDLGYVLLLGEQFVGDRLSLYNHTTSPIGTLYAATIYPGGDKIS